MLTEDQATFIGAALVRQAKASELARRNAAARRVPFLYRFSELNRFEAWERFLIISEARKAVLRTRSFVAVWVASALTAVALGYILVVPSRTVQIPFIWLIAVAMLAPMHFFHRKLMREHIRRKAEQVTRGQGQATHGAG
ncbi:MAG: hypothetical protein JF606_22855 [Burkholderiales bacterium]|nr:hypothetical protein [Burkholderiales bacterium]